MPKMESTNIAKFAKEYMNWLQSNERKHIFKIENKDYLYVRFARYEIEYIYKKDMTSNNVSYDACYNTKKKFACLVHGLKIATKKLTIWKNLAFMIKKK